MATFGFDEPSLNFYLLRGPIAKLESAGDVATWSARAAPGVLVIRRELWRELEQSTGPLGLSEIACSRGFNYSIGKEQELVALGRKLPARDSSAR